MACQDARPKFRLLALDIRTMTGLCRRGPETRKEQGRMHDAFALVRFPGRVLLSRDAFGHSTIGAEGLNCRVRDGNGCFTLAMATGNLARRLSSGAVKFSTI